VLLVYKRSFLERRRTELRLAGPIPRSERGRIEAADRENQRTLRHVRDELAARGLRVDMVYRGVLSVRKKYDLVVTVGGDGTFFLASHAVESTPVLGVNSDPDHSLGLHCGADRRTLSRVLDQVLRGTAPVVRLARLAIFVNGRRVRAYAVNDVLFASPNPALMSRYDLSIDGGPAERQRSSGVWFCTASGSTAGTYAAGGRPMPLASRRMQYVVREPYGWPRRPRWLRGFWTKRAELRCEMDAGAAWIDGSRRRIDLALGDRVVIRAGAPPLTVLNLDDARRRRLFSPRRDA